MKSEMDSNCQESKKVSPHTDHTEVNLIFLIYRTDCHAISKLIKCAGSSWNQLEANSKRDSEQGKATHFTNPIRSQIAI